MPATAQQRIGKYLGQQLDGGPARSSDYLGSRRLVDEMFERGIDALAHEPPMLFAVHARALLLRGQRLDETLTRSPRLEIWR